MFFVLSGFLITSLLIDARQERSYYHDFYWKRALRILPLYLLCLLGVLLFLPDLRGYVLLSTFFISNFAGLFHVATNGPFWTLAIEEQFYLIWPTVVRRRTIPQLRHWAIAIGSTAFLLRFIAAAFGHYNYAFTFFRCDGLAFGAFLACWFVQRNPQTANTSRETRLMSLGVLLGIVCVSLSLLPGLQADSIAFSAAFRQSGVTLLCGSVIAFLILGTGSRSLSFFRSRLLTFFGLISYAMYMTHLYVLMAYDHFRGPLHPGDTPSYALRFVAVLGITIVLCVITRYVVELPAISLRKHVLARPAPASPADPPLPLGRM
ncbi:MAG: acyltransferase [Edaphobacter sp.]